MYDQLEGKMPPFIFQYLKDGAQWAKDYRCVRYQRSELNQDTLSTRSLMVSSNLPELLTPEEYLFYA